jgi:hypothetical protein
MHNFIKSWKLFEGGSLLVYFGGSNLVDLGTQYLAVRFWLILGFPAIVLWFLKHHRIWRKLSTRGTIWVAGFTWMIRAPRSRSN